MAIKCLMGGIKVGPVRENISGTTNAFYLCLFTFCIFCHLRFYPTASVGSRNALHVVGVTPVLHVVRSCTTVMAVME